MTWKPDICVYHANCDDGFGAAWAVHKKWGDDVVFVPGAYGSPIEWPKDIHGKNILFVDFSLKRDKMIELANGGLTGQVPRSIVVLDHHKTAQAELKEWDAAALDLAGAETLFANQLVNGALPILALFNMQKSGARLAWEFCFPGKAIPRLIEHIEDRDLWRFAIVGTAEVSAALRTYDKDFRTWDRLDYHRLLREGAPILRAHRKNIENFMPQRRIVAIAGHEGVPVLNVPYHYASDSADFMLSVEPDAPFCACWFMRADGKFQFSLRSRDDREDVSEIAKKFGGGGHRNAAGFECDVLPFDPPADKENGAENAAEA